MSDGAFPGQNIQHNSKGTGYHWYTQYNYIRAWPSQAPSCDSRKMTETFSSRNLSGKPIPFLEPGQYQLLMFAPFLPSFSCLAGMTFSHGNSFLDNYVSSDPSKGEKYLERTNKRENKCLGALCEGMENCWGRQTKKHGVRNTVFNFYLLACHKKPWDGCRF